MKQKYKVNLALFFTYGVSLKLWNDIGLIKREIALYNKLSQNLEKIYFFTYGDKTDLKYKHLLADNIIIVQKPFKMSNKIYSLLLPIIHKKMLKNCNIFKTNQMDGAWTAVLSKIFFRKKLIIRTGYCWSNFLKLLNKKRKYFLARIIENIAYRFADLAIVTSEQDKSYILNKYNCTTVKIIRNYVDTELFKPLKFKKKKNEICFVGRLSKQKNLLMLIKAIKNTNIKLNLIGDGEEKEKIIDLAKQNYVKINLHGIVSNDKLPQLLNQFEIFVLPSHFEGNPKTLLEAMACGLCCIGTNVEGICEVIKHNKTGILCSKNVESLRNSIVTANKNQILRKRLGNNSIKFIQQNCALNATTEKEISVIESLNK